MRRIVLGRAVLAASLCSGLSVAQTLRPRAPAGTQQTTGAAMLQRAAENAEAAPVTMPMSAAAIPIKVALDSEVRVRTVGQTIHGRTMELLLFSGARTRCGLSERHGHGDRARNSGYQVNECARTVCVVPSDRIERV